eukprot:1308665-Karenia_brevis.AAC.1
MAMRSHVHMRPYDVFSQGISDHSIIHLCLHPVALKPKHLQNIPHWVAKSDVFRGFMRASSRALQNSGFGLNGHNGQRWGSLHAYSKLKAYK